MTDVPFAIGEEFSSKWQFAPYIEQGLTNFARVDICNVGGFTEAMKVAGWCEVHYIDLMPHNPLGPVCTAASVHMGAAVPNWAWLEDRGADLGRLYSDELFPVQPKLDGVWYPVPDTPAWAWRLTWTSSRNSPSATGSPPTSRDPTGPSRTGSGGLTMVSCASAALAR